MSYYDSFTVARPDAFSVNMVDYCRHCFCKEGDITGKKRCCKCGTIQIHENHFIDLNFNSKPLPPKQTCPHCGGTGKI